jgi:SAM-dependent methyltransferase
MGIASGLKEHQYNDSSKFNDRIYLHSKFSTNKYPWPLWIFDNIDKTRNAKVLELGCGTGLLWKTNANRIPGDWDITLSDFSEGMLHDAIKNLDGFTQNLKYEVIDAEQIKYPDSSFDIIIANNMLYHLPDVRQAISEICRVLKQTGKFYSTTMGCNDMKEIRDIIKEFNPSSKHNESVGLLRENFSLENGEQQLKASFNEVKLIRREDSLEITESDPLIKYFLSCNGIAGNKVSLNEDSQRKFKEFLDRKINANGKIHISKDSGMFISNGKKLIPD